MERRTRGIVLNGYQKFIEHEWGVAELKIARADIGIDNLDFKDGNYYQDEIIGNLLRWIHRNKGREAVKDAGRFILHNLGILSWMVRFSDFRTLAKKFPKNFSEVYAFGNCRLDDSDPRSIKLILKDVGYYEEACLVWEGICEEALVITKTAGRVKHTKCEMKGDEFSEFTVELY